MPSRSTPRWTDVTGVMRGGASRRPAVARAQRAVLVAIRAGLVAVPGGLPTAPGGRPVGRVRPVGPWPRAVAVARRLALPLLPGVAACFLACGEGDGAPREILEGISLPPGFRIELFAEDVPGARSLALGPAGTIFVGTRGDRVYALRDEDGDHRADRVIIVASGLDSPNGVAVRDGALYVAEIHRILRYEGIESRLADPPAPGVVRDDFPRDALHGWKFIAFAPTGSSTCRWACRATCARGRMRAMRPSRA